MWGKSASPRTPRELCECDELIDSFVSYDVDGVQDESRWGYATASNGSTCSFQILFDFELIMGDYLSNWPHDAITSRWPVWLLPLEG